MSTWHQDHVKTKLYHSTLWTVVLDPPNTTRCLVTFDNEDEARRYHIQLIGRNVRANILPPV